MIDELSVTRVIRADSTSCHTLVADLESYPDWARDLEDVRIEDRDDLGRARVATFRVAAMGRTATYTLEYDHSEAPSVLSWRLLEGDIVSRLEGHYRFEDVDDEPGATEVSYALAVELAIPLPGFVKRRAEGRIMHAALDDLQARLER